MTGAGYYAAYGLRIRSEVALPQFGPAAPGEPDVLVRLGLVPAALSDPLRTTRLWQASPGDFLLRVGGKCRIRVTGGREITVERLGGAEDGLAALHIVSSAWTALLQQRGFLTLHASAVWTERGATLFLGDSGAGKSTLAAALAVRGFNVLTDDVAAVSVCSRGPPRVAPGYPNLRLWPDAFDRLRLAVGPARRARNGLDKYLLPAERFAPEPQILRAAYVLGNGSAESIELSGLTTAEAFRSLRRLTHRRRYVDALGMGEAHFRALGDIARQVSVTRVRRPASGITLNALAERIERHLGAGSRRST